MQPLNNYATADGAQIGSGNFWNQYLCCVLCSWNLQLQTVACLKRSSAGSDVLRIFFFTFSSLFSPLLDFLFFSGFILIFFPSAATAGCPSILYPSPDSQPAMTG